ncbi:MAG: sulfatase/phosphatase domain-containing protein, partial [Planctomycetota bacterium]
AIRTDRYRLIEWKAESDGFCEYELYDHQSDPMENTSLAKRPEYAQTVKQLAEQLHAGWQAARPRQ